MHPLNNLGWHLETGDRLGPSALQLPVHGQAHLGIDLQDGELPLVNYGYAGLQRTAHLGFAILGKDVVTRAGSVDTDEG